MGNMLLEACERIEQLDFEPEASISPAAVEVMERLWDLEDRLYSPKPEAPISRRRYRRREGNPPLPRWIAVEKAA